MIKSNCKWTIHDLLERRASVLFPEYQREPNVWSLQKKQRLIDSILRGFDISPIYLFNNGDNTYDCIDGRQRINAILSFLGVNDEADHADNNFILKIVNEIFDDMSDFVTSHDGKAFTQLPEHGKEKILSYEINVVKIENVENEQELNLLFLRLQLGTILNAGEKLHAMTGFMRQYVFADLSSHEFFRLLSIPYRRYAKEQVAAQIALNYFTRVTEDEFSSSRFTDLQAFFRQHSSQTESDLAHIQSLEHALNIIQEHFGDRIRLIRSRAIAISVFLFSADLISNNRVDELRIFVEFFVSFMRTLAWQVPKGIRIDPEYEEILKFQSYVTQAAGEKYAIRRRHELWLDYFQYFKDNRMIKGDSDYATRTGELADDARRNYLVI